MVYPKQWAKHEHCSSMCRATFLITEKLLTSIVETVSLKEGSDGECHDSKCQDFFFSSREMPFFGIALPVQTKYFFEHRNLAAHIDLHNREISYDGSAVDITSSYGSFERNVV